MLTGNEIWNQYNQGEIFISSFDPKKLGPNSYDLTLDDKFLEYSDIHTFLDMKKNNKMNKIKIEDYGFVLWPGHLYLGKTRERTTTRNLIPMIEGRSSIGRLGISIHITAGFGDIGFNGYWTLEISCIHPIKIYPFIKICQIFYFKPKGKITKRYEGKYQNNTNVQSSKSFEDFE